jgi:hypothetical protein
MNQQDKLRVLIPHWIEHNEEHAEEFRQWAEHAGAAAPEVQAAADAMVRANEYLSQALDKLNGPVPHANY